MKNFVQSADTLRLTAPYTVTAGQGALVNDIFGVAAGDVTSGSVGSFAVVGAYSLAKTSAQAWAVGETIYWDNTNKRCDNTPTAGFVKIGTCIEAASNPSSTGKVRLDGTGVPSSGSASLPAAASYSTAGPQTYTAADIIGRTIVRDPNGAARSDVLPTAALLVAALPGVQVGDVIDCLIVNGADAAETITIGAGSGGAFDANQTAASRVIPQNTSKTVRIRFTSVTAASEAYVVYV
jgi:predicted RecA/RadA family phage recombinase